MIRRDEPARDLAALPAGYGLAGLPATRRALLQVAASAAICSSVQPEPTAGIVRRPSWTIFASAAGSLSVGEPAIRGPMPPSPFIPWHLAQTPVHCSLPSSPEPVVLLGPALLEPGVERGWRHDLDRREHSCVLESAELGALAGVRPLLVGLEPRVVRPAGDRVDLAAERGIHQEWMTSASGATTEPDGRARRRAQVVDRDDAVRILVLPVELAAGHLDLELLLAGGRVRDVLDPGSSMKTNAAMTNRTITGPAVHASSSFVAPWTGAPSSKRGRFRRLYFQMNAIRSPSTSRKIENVKIVTKR